jgi:glycosyltransferase involved in cell wall biosynthesis
MPVKDALVEPLRALGAEVNCFATPGVVSMMTACRRIALYCRREGIALLHCHLPLTGVIGRVAGLLAGIPVVYSEHSKQEGYHPLTRLASRLTWRWQKDVVAISEAVKKSIEHNLGARIPIRVVLNGVDTRRFTRDPATGLDVRRKIGIPDGAPVVGTVAVFRTPKRLDHWVDAARRVHRQLPDAHFIVVGDGPLMTEIREAARAAELTSAIHFAGLREDVRPWLSAMDVFMMTSEVEGLPLALLEAMAMECAAAATAVGGIPEVISDATVGVCVAPGEIHALSDRVAELLQCPEARQTMAKAGRQTVEQRFSIVRMTREIEAIYDLVLNGGHAH